MIVQHLDQKKQFTSMTIATSKNHVSPEITSWINKKIVEEKIVFKLVNPRKRKLGDYRYYKNNKQHKITVNNDLDEDLFFLTFIHELAHKKTFDQYGRRVQPHGVEWKQCFQKLLIEGLEITDNPKTVKTLTSSITSPRASIRIKDETYDGLTITDLQMNDTFKLKNSDETYILKEKRRTRYSCIAKSNNKQYSVSSDAQVTKCN